MFSNDIGGHKNQRQQHTSATPEVRIEDFQGLQRNYATKVINGRVL